MTITSSMDTHLAPLSSVQASMVTPIRTYNHNFYSGLVYVLNGVTGTALSVATAAQAVLSLLAKSLDAGQDATDVINESLEQLHSVPESMGLRRYFSVFTGVSNIIEGNHLIAEARHQNYLWGIADGVMKIARGVFESSAGFIQGTTKALTVWAENNINVSSIDIANMVGDLLSSLQLLIISISTLHNARLSGDLKRKIRIEPCNIPLAKKVNNLFWPSIRCNPLPSIDLAKRRIEVVKSILNDPNSRDQKIHLEKMMGSDFMHKLTNVLNGQDLSLSSHHIDEVLKKLSSSEFSNAILGTVSLLGAITTVVADVCTVGIASQIMSLIKPLIAFTFFYYDVAQLKAGVNNTVSASRINQIMRYALTALAISLAVFTFVGASAGTGGALPIAMLVIGITMPLITLYMANNPGKITKGLKSIGSAFNYLNPFAYPVNFKGYRRVIQEEPAIEMSSLAHSHSA